MDDLTSLGLALGGLFALLALWMVRQEIRADRLAKRLSVLETTTKKSGRRKGGL